MQVKALSLMRQRNFQRAADAFRLIPPGSALHAEARFHMITCLLADYQMEAAESALRDYVTDFPDSLHAIRQLCGLLSAQLRHAEAVEVLHEFVAGRGFPSLSIEQQLQILRECARFEFDPEPPTTTTAMLETSLERHPEQPSVVCALGRCYLADGNLPMSEQYFRQLVSDFTLGDSHLMSAAEFFLQVDQLDTARSLLEGLNEAEIKNVNVSKIHREQYCDVQSRLAERSGDPESAARYLQLAVDLKPLHKHYRSRQARLLQRLGRVEDAQRAYQESHRLARIDLDLWNLTRSLPDTPAPSECRKTASLYLSRGDQLLAHAWQSAASQIESRIQAAQTTTSED